MVVRDTFASGIELVLVQVQVHVQAHPSFPFLRANQIHDGGCPMPASVSSATVAFAFAEFLCP